MEFCSGYNFSKQIHPIKLNTSCQRKILWSITLFMVIISLDIQSFFQLEVVENRIWVSWTSLVGFQMCKSSVFASAGFLLNLMHSTALHMCYAACAKISSCFLSWAQLDSTALFLQLSSCFLSHISWQSDGGNFLRAKSSNMWSTFWRKEKEGRNLSLIMLSNFSFYHLN